MLHKVVCQIANGSGSIRSTRFSQHEFSQLFRIHNTLFRGFRITVWRNRKTDKIRNDSNLLTLWFFVCFYGSDIETLQLRNCGINSLCFSTDSRCHICPIDWIYFNKRQNEDKLFGIVRFGKNVSILPQLATERWRCCFSLIRRYVVALLSPVQADLITFPAPGFHLIKSSQRVCTRSGLNDIPSR